MAVSTNQKSRISGQRRLVLCLIAAPALLVTTIQADARPSTRSFTCSGLKDFIADHGAVVMNHKNSSLYQRFVDNRSYCEYRETTIYFTVPTKTGRCRLKICKEPLDYRFPWGD